MNGVFTVWVERGTGSQLSTDIGFTSNTRYIYSASLGFGFPHTNDKWNWHKHISHPSIGNCFLFLKKVHTFFDRAAVVILQLRLASVYHNCLTTWRKTAHYTQRNTVLILMVFKKSPDNLFMWQLKHISIILLHISWTYKWSFSITREPYCCSDGFVIYYSVSNLSEM